MRNDYESHIIRNHYVFFLLLTMILLRTCCDGKAG